MKDIVKITKAANKKLIELVKKHNNNNVFFSVKGGGCNSFDYRTKMHNNSYKYNLEPLKYPPSNLMHCVKKDNYNIYICEYGYEHIVNTTIDWECNVMDERFTFHNPNAKYVYKCQNSFISKHT